MFTPDLMFTKYEADPLYQKITYITKTAEGQWYPSLCFYT